MRSLTIYHIAVGCICCLIGCSTSRMNVAQNCGLSKRSQCDATSKNNCGTCKNSSKSCAPEDDCRCHEPASQYNLSWDDCTTGLWAKKRADKNLKPMDEGKCKVSCDFKAGYKQGYADVAKGYSGKTPAVAPPKYWKHYYRSENGKWRPEQWFDGYASGVESAYAEGLAQARYVAASHVSTVAPCGTGNMGGQMLIPAYSQVIQQQPDGESMPGYVPQIGNNWSPETTIPQGTGHTWSTPGAENP